jgi:hypothetical protein
MFKKVPVGIEGGSCECCVARCVGQPGGRTYCQLNDEGGETGYRTFVSGEEGCSNMPWIRNRLSLPQVNLGSRSGHR